jgi:hypothetical protein
VLKGSEVQSETKLVEKKEDEEVDLGYIDFFEPDPLTTGKRTRIRSYRHNGK